MVNDVLVEEFELDAESLRPDATIFEDLGLDSLDAVDLIVLIEKRAGVRMEDEQAKSIRTLGDIYNFIEQHVSDAGDAPPTSNPA